MNTQIVYVSTSGPDDLYFEETALSAYSLKSHQPDAYVVLVVDQDTRKAITGNREKLLCYFDNVQVVQCPDEYNQHQRSRYLKTTLRERIKGDFLYIDGDTIICQPLAAIDQCHASVAAAIDKHLSLAVHPRRESTDQNLAKYFNYKRTQKDVNFFNSGLLFVRDDETAHRLYAEWHRLWKEGLGKGLKIDQPALLIANHNCGYPIQELDGTWNCQVMDNGLRYLVNAKILHYFASNGKDTCFLLKEKAIFQEMKQTGIINEHTKEIVSKARQAFAEKVMLVADSEADFMTSHIYTCYRHHNWLYKIINNTLGVVFRAF